MIKLNLKNKANKQHFIVGALVGVIAGAFIPDQFNPGIIVQDMIENFRK